MLAAAGAADVPCLVRCTGSRGALEARRLEALADAAALAGALATALPIATAAGVAALDGDVLRGATTTHHLCLPALPGGTRVAPPLGDHDDRDALWEALRSGRLETVVSDHLPPPLRGSDEHVGIGGIELRVAALHALGVVPGRIDLRELAEIVAARPARRLGLWPRKGSLQVGADGDVVLLDPAERETVRHGEPEGRGRAPAFEGRELTGRVVTVLARGDVVVRERTVLFRPGRGRAAERA